MLTTGNLIQLKIPRPCDDCYGITNGGGIFQLNTNKNHFTEEDINEILQDTTMFKRCKCFNDFALVNTDINTYEVVPDYIDKNDYLCTIQFDEKNNSFLIKDKELLKNRCWYEIDCDDNKKKTPEEQAKEKAEEKEETKNIRKTIANSKQSDKKKLNWTGRGKLDSVGDITYEYIHNLLTEQEYECYSCGDPVLTHSYVPYCSYKFSIDRIDNDKPHNKDNVKISCYFCNCKDHNAFNRTEKLKCKDEKCFCNKL